MTTDRKLITDACVITLDPNLGDLARADILIDDGRIVEIAPDIQVDDAERIDASQMIAIPGFVDAHIHAWQSTLRGIISDMTFIEYMTTILNVYGPLHRAEDKYAGVLASSLMALDSGVTTLVEYATSVENPDHADATIEGLREAGIRGVYGHGTPAGPEWFQNSDLRQDPAEAHRVRSTHFSSDDDLLRFGMAPRGPELTTPSANRADFELARELSAPITTHIIQPGMIERMKDYLGPDTCYVHCSHSTDLDLQLIRDSGGAINIPAECDMSFHSAPITNRVVDLGMKPSLGIDGGGVNSPDMFVEMRMALQEVRMREYDANWQKNNDLLWELSYSSRDALEWATIEGARHFGLDDIVGTLTPGKQADIVLVRHDSLRMSPASNPVAAVVDTAMPHDVDTVIVAGEVKKRDGKLVGVDVERVRRMLYQARDRLFSDAGVPRTCDLRLPYRSSSVSSA